MSKADDARELAGYVAPIVRGTSETLLRRRVHTYDRETGEVTGEVTMRQVIGGLAEVTKLEIEVIDGKRPKHFACDGCGKVAKLAKTGPVRKTCKACQSGCQTVCPCGCGSVPPSHAFQSRVVAKRGGPWVCRSTAARKAAAAMTPKQLAAWSARSGRGLAAKTPEQRSEIARAREAAMTAEQRSARARRRESGMTPEQRSEAGRKSWATRRAKVAVLPSQDGGAEKTGADD